MLLQQNVVSQTEGQTKWINILDVEEEKSPPYPEDVVTDSKEKTMNSKDTTLATTP
jgi:hypothetical protein